MLYTYIRFCFAPKINPADPPKSKAAAVLQLTKAYSNGRVILSYEVNIKENVI